MKTFGIISILCLLINPSFSQMIISTVADGESDIRWGSVSASGPNWGFYGQEIDLKEDSKLSSISVFIYDHKDHDETEATINFALWEMKERPSSQIFLSAPEKIEKKHVGGWIEYELPAPLSLKAGKYLIVVGQPKPQGFVAFGSQQRKEGYHGKAWNKAPLMGFTDGKEWLTIRDIVEKIGGAGQGINIEEMESHAVMMKVKLSE